MTEQVILVDDQDQLIGTEEKLKAHQHGLRHRAFSIFIADDTRQSLRLLLQQRQWDKYHCGGLWTNTCCSHPRPGETIIAAGQRRLYEEMGIADVDLQAIGVFHYIAHFDDGLTENEIDHVLLGFWRPQKFVVNDKEVADYAWLRPEQINADYARMPDNYTPWFKQAFDIVLRQFDFK
ncbi:MAG: isopentenyl-diphosphate Delta-isomerase [Pseudomonadota bacterium]